MSVAENTALAVGYAKRGGRIDWPATEARAQATLAHFKADFAPTAPVSSLTRTEKSLVTIARALAAECDVLVLDKPTASLPADEVKRLFAALRPLKAKGVGMIYVSHRLDKVFQISDRVAVLRDGQLVGARDTAQTMAEDLVNLIVGRKTREIDRPAVQEGPELLTAAGLANHKGGQAERHSHPQFRCRGLCRLGHSTIRRLVLGRAAVQRLYAADPNRHRGIRATQKRSCAQVIIIKREDDTCKNGSF